MCPGFSHFSCVCILLYIIAKLATSSIKVKRKLATLPDSDGILLKGEMSFTSSHSFEYMTYTLWLNPLISRTMSEYILHIERLAKRSRLLENAVRMRVHFITPSNAEATFLQSTRTQTFSKTIQTQTLLVPIGKLSSTDLPGFQSF